MIRYYKQYPTFKTADEYYHAAMKYQANPKGVSLDSRYLNHLWERFDELNVFTQPHRNHSMRNQY